MVDFQRNLSEKERYIFEKVENSIPVLWINPNKTDRFPENHSYSFQVVLEAEKRLKRFSSYIKLVFPETKNLQGIIESKLIEIPNMKQLIEKHANKPLAGKLLLKCDHELPVSGSIKARGGIYEVLKFAEHIAFKHGFIKETDDYAAFQRSEFKELFSRYKIAVGSTGNLGLSIGIMAAKLGFQVTVHMSMDAKEWKKKLLREKGVQVIEYASDYSLAVEEGRRQAADDSMCHFVDDENSIDLFSGYAVSALRLKNQLEQLNIRVDQEHPLFVYLPCGVGGGPGGVAYGLKAIYKEHVHIFFGEPTQSPCMLLGMMTGLHDNISVMDIGLTNRTEADGLAVGRPSKFVGKLMEPILSGCYTVADDFLFESLKEMARTEGIFMEPSSHASVYGPIQLLKEGKTYLEHHGLLDKLNQATHLLWGTGGNMVPQEEREKYLNKTI
ncbi:D-serine ammonia-lyase [Ureibacillus sp. FSL K6-8385]|uniref:Probable D-serine dehydratase n=1 Tax=Ureibacillus terrenus TaxID=118246 RepID=A0A540V6D6_9BACL|nr:D-serine ammonia-lyase [Ureibacillus terrenus]MED3660680.1 D-serine ammonia-lyase [Ureibacillus terrenus]TQE92330.1 D-serine ammonia-lyase [Ureibacillus terrenus]